MRSKTSFFNRTLFAESFTRFWPIWAGYLLIWILLLPVPLLSNRGFYSSRESWQAAVTILDFGVYSGVIFGAIMAAVAAMAVWSYLYKPRSAHGIACLPLRRESVFLSTALGGIVPAVAVHLIVAVLTALVGALIGLKSVAPVVEWFGLVTLFYLFYFCFASFCAQLTGSVVILPILYGVLNFLAVGVEVLLRGVFVHFLYGLADLSWSRGMPVTRWLSPAVGQLSGMEVVNDVVAGVRRVYVTGWAIPWIYAAVGLLLLGAALLLYRRRRMESAGDVVAVNVIKPVFRWVMALGAALSLGGLLFTIFFLYSADHYGSLAFFCMLLFLLFGGFLGWFVAAMLLKKSFRVFNGRNWAGWGLVCAVIVVLMLCVRLDVFGVVNRVPDPAQVESVTVAASGEKAVMTTPEGVAQVEELHRAILADRDYNENSIYFYGNGQIMGSMDVVITYKLKGGRELMRVYWLKYNVNDPSDGGEAALVQALMNSPEAVAHRKRPEQISPTAVDSARIYASMTLAEAVELDGYDSAEEWLMDRGWLTREEWRKLSEDERQITLTQVLLSQGDSKFADRAGMGLYDETGELQPFDTLDPDAIWVETSVWLNTAEARRFVEEALREDLAEGLLGRTYILNDDAFATETYAAGIELELSYWELSPGLFEDYAYHKESDGKYHIHFSTTPTVAAYRTADWLQTYGVPLHTPAEIENS